MKKDYRVFVSSTYEDLKVERQMIMTALLEQGFAPVAMENFLASPLPKWEFITNMIDSSDYFILIVAGRYGSIDSKVDKSFTEREYNYATEKGIPVLIFLHADPESIPSGKCEKVDDLRKRLKSFRETLQNGDRLVKYYSKQDDLVKSVSDSLKAAIMNLPSSRGGRAREIGSDHSIQDGQTKQSISHLGGTQLEEAPPVGSSKKIAQNHSAEPHDSFPNGVSAKQEMTRNLLSNTNNSSMLEEHRPILGIFTSGAIDNQICVHLVNYKSEPVFDVILTNLRFEIGSTVRYFDEKHLQVLYEHSEKKIWLNSNSSLFTNGSEIEAIFSGDISCYNIHTTPYRQTFQIPVINHGGGSHLHSFAPIEKTNI